MYQVRHDTITADRLLLPGPGVYYGGVLQADGVGAATAIVYDGNLAQVASIIDRLYAATSTVDRSTPPVGIPYEIGLLVDLGSNVTSMTVWYEPLAHSTPTPSPG